MRRLAIPLGAIFLAVAAWAGIASALAGSAPPPTNDAPGYRRHASTPPAPDESGPRVDAAVQLEPLPPPSIPAYLPRLAPVAPAKAAPAQQAPAKQINVTQPATDTKAGARKEATPVIKRTPTPEPRQSQFDGRRRGRD